MINVNPSKIKVSILTDFEFRFTTDERKNQQSINLTFRIEQYQTSNLKPPDHGYHNSLLTFSNDMIF